jgi:transposase
MKTKNSTAAKMSKVPAVQPAPVRHRHTKEFKLQAVELLRLGNKNATELAMELGITRSMLYRWAGVLEGKGADALRGSGRPPGEQDSEVVRLRRELAQAKEELDILKKAATYFAKQLP